MRYAALLLFLSVLAHANETVRDGLTRQLRTIQRQLTEEKTNLKTSEANLLVIEGDFQKLKKLETDHLQLKTDLQDQIKANPNHDKGKARQAFLFKAEKLVGEVTRQLADVQSRFGPLEKERISWTERKAKHEKAVAELGQQEIQLQEKLGHDSSEPPPVSDAPAAE